MSGRPYQAACADALPHAGHIVHAKCASQCGQRARVAKVSNEPPHPSGAQIHCMPTGGENAQSGQAIPGRVNTAQGSAT
jgi:hypothetical protein